MPSDRFALLLALPLVACASTHAVDGATDSTVAPAAAGKSDAGKAPGRSGTSLARVTVTVDGMPFDARDAHPKKDVEGAAFEAFFVEPDLLVLDHEALRPLLDSPGSVELTLADGTPLTHVRSGSVVDGLVVLEAAGGSPLALGSAPDLAKGDRLQHLQPFGGSATWMEVASLVEPEVRLGRRRATTPAVLSEWLGIWAAPGRPVVTASGAVAGVELEATLERAWLVPRATLDALLERAHASEPRSLEDYVAEAITPTGTPGELVTSGPDGRLVLDCARAVCHGERLQLERKGWWHGLGYWTDADDVATWNVELEQETTFDVRVLSSCPDGTAGTPVALGIQLSAHPPGTGPFELTYDVPPTDSFLDFRWSELGRLTLPAGRSTLTLLPLAAPPLAVMDLDRFELTPIVE